MASRWRCTAKHYWCCMRIVCKLSRKERGNHYLGRQPIGGALCPLGGPTLSSFLQSPIFSELYLPVNLSSPEKYNVKPRSAPSFGAESIRHWVTKSVPEGIKWIRVDFKGKGSVKMQNLLLQLCDPIAIRRVFVGVKALFQLYCWWMTADMFSICY